MARPPLLPFPENDQPSSGQTEETAAPVPEPPQQQGLFLLLALLASPALADPSITVAFSPIGGATEAIIQTINRAEHTIRLAAYVFTSRPIAEALIAAHRRGVDVEAVFDRSNATARYTAAKALAAAGRLHSDTRPPWWLTRRLTDPSTGKSEKTLATSL